MHILCCFLAITIDVLSSGEIFLKCELKAKLESIAGVCQPEAAFAPKGVVLPVTMFLATRVESLWASSSHGTHAYISYLKQCATEKTAFGCWFLGVWDSVSPWDFNPLSLLGKRRGGHPLWYHSQDLPAGGAGSAAQGWGSRRAARPGWGVWQGWIFQETWDTGWLECTVNPLAFPRKRSLGGFLKGISCI